MVEIKKIEKFSSLFFDKKISNWFDQCRF